MIIFLIFIALFVYKFSSYKKKYYEWREINQKRLHTVVNMSLAERTKVAVEVSEDNYEQQRLDIKYTDTVSITVKQIIKTLWESLIDFNAVLVRRLLLSQYIKGGKLRWVK